jgi:thymidylate synthase ThyX
MQAKVLANSINDNIGTLHGLITVYAKFPRIIEPEILRHRAFSFSAASSRAINSEKHINKVDIDFFMPYKFTKEQKGMSAREFVEGQPAGWATIAWGLAGNECIKQAKELVKQGVHKQHATRLLQPFEYQEMIITGTYKAWNNFFELRCPRYYIPGVEDEYYSLKEIDHVITKYDLQGFDKSKHNNSQAQPEIQQIAELIYDLVQESRATRLNENEWHLPFGRFTEDIQLDQKINCAKCARISYLSDNKDWTKDQELYDRLVKDNHWSPLEHVARPLNQREYEKSSLRQEYEVNGNTHLKIIPGSFYNLEGFISLRFLEEHKF